MAPPRIQKGPTGLIKGLRELLKEMKRKDILKTISEFSLDYASLYGYANSTHYDLVYDGVKYPPKAVFGLAAARIIGRPLTSDEFEGGEKTPCFAIIRSLGFNIIEKNPDDSLSSNIRSLKPYHFYELKEISQIFQLGIKFKYGSDQWGMSDIIEIPKGSGNFVFIVTLGDPKEGNSYRDDLTANGFFFLGYKSPQCLKSKITQKLIAHNSGENNIYLFLRPEKGIKYIYLGLLDYSDHNLIETNLVRFMWRIKKWDLDEKEFEKLLLLSRTTPDIKYYCPVTNKQFKLQTLKPTQPPVRSKVTIRKSTSKSLEVKNIDWAERDRRNRKLGMLGEKLVVQYEVSILREAGRNDLAEQVHHIAAYDATVGFDVASFFLDGRPKRIEVKTTTGAASTPFYISMNEVLASRDDPSSYVIYRIFKYNPESFQIDFYQLKGNVEHFCNLKPINFLAYPINPFK